MCAIDFRGRRKSRALGASWVHGGTCAGRDGAAGIARRVRARRPVQGRSSTSMKTNAQDQETAATTKTATTNDTYEILPWVVRTPRPHPTAFACTRQTNPPIICSGCCCCCACCACRRYLHVFVLLLCAHRTAGGKEGEATAKYADDAAVWRMTTVTWLGLLMPAFVHDADGPSLGRGMFSSGKRDPQNTLLFVL